MAKASCTVKKPHLASTFLLLIIAIINTFYSNFVTTTSAWIISKNKPPQTILWRQRCQRQFQRQCQHRCVLHTHLLPNISVDTVDGKDTKENIIILLSSSSSSLQTQKKYLERIGFSQKEIAALLDDDHFSPNFQMLQRLLSAHLLTVPFENLDQHHHPAHGDNTPEILRKTEDNGLPTLNVMRSVEKIAYQHRGGFCFELNFSFCWLLRSLGYETRLVLTDVGCKQETPAHVVILVDGISLPSSTTTTTTTSSSNYDDDEDGCNGDDVCTTAILVDVGFGCPGVCDVLLPLQYNHVTMDPHGDIFRFDVDNIGSTSTTDQEKNSKTIVGNDAIAIAIANPSSRYNTALYRTRIDTGTEEPMYRFHSDDALDYDSEEFAAGLHRVLNISPTFTGKRLCVVSTDKGHITLGKDYIKWVEQWKTVKQIELPTETNWRDALQNYFKIEL
jgi:arylamine N-acetyltransferase